MTKPTGTGRGKGLNHVRLERLAVMAGLRMHTGHDPAPPGHVTAAQAAKRLGVSARTIERYKRILREAGGGDHAGT